MSRILFKEVTKSFARKVVAVDRVSFEVKSGEFFVILGPSGCGKSTLLRLVAGLEEPDSGEIYIDDRLVNNLEPKDRDIAMVFQNYALYPHMSVFENLAFSLRLRHIPKGEIERRVVNAAKVLGIEELLNRKPSELSGGQRQRVAVGRAIVRNPKVFLFDEPLSNLDAKLRVGMRAELIRLHQQLRTTILYVTHDQVEAMTLGERIAIMKDGKILQVDQPRVIYDRPLNKFVAGFIGAPPMNFFTGKILAGNPPKFVHPAVTIELPLSIKESREVILGIRPEHIEVCLDSGLRGRVEVIEHLGNETVVYLRLDGETVVLRTKPELSPKPNETVGIKFQLEKIHLFDPETETRII